MATVAHATKVCIIFYFMYIYIAITEHTDKMSNRISCWYYKPTNYILFYLQNVAFCSDAENVAYNLKSINRPMWNFSAHQSLYSTFPIDPVKENYVRKVKNILFSVVKPMPFRTKVSLVSASLDVVLNILNIDPSQLETKEFIDVVGGMALPKASIPLAHRYGGHQFGYWADQLGDGRAMLLGEIVNSNGERWELHLKGSGPTPYSRRGDGRSVLRSSIREFLCSEAMHYLGIPTTRAAALVVSNDKVLRDVFYDGHPKEERAAVVLRVASSWFRIGSLEILAFSKEYNLLKQLTDFVIQQHFPNINFSDTNKYIVFFSEVVSNTASLIAQWQSVGFAHGVLNTDNFSLLSITIDYGPFGFMDVYDPEFVPNTSDDEKRYSFEKQPDVGLYSLNKLRIALLPLLTKEQQTKAKYVLQGYVNLYKKKFMEIYRKKLGLVGQDDDDEELIALFLKMMQDTASDFSITFRQLGEICFKTLRNLVFNNHLWALKTLTTHEWFPRWVKLYSKRVEMSGITEDERQTLMNSVNPVYILRNWIAQNATSIAEYDDFSGVQKVLKVLQNPYTRQPEADESGFADPVPTWAKDLKVSCSS
ncbi:protein adenylyltransferase SelO, mitochondrial-like [Gigantopelta aegis]|uniref:protein adenylyltransferase SelO, mitochondrial-like n=1 Tax=Gigantopelta aegis TaxID=1735272 RepID=UPI001B88D246|nr:protein adenylyltransferase SelO, mitochondrial-like [Gigantopelta aegis]